MQMKVQLIHLKVPRQFFPIHKKIDHQVKNTSLVKPEIQDSLK